jgi:hypothetical protein
VAQSNLMVRAGGLIQVPTGNKAIHFVNLQKKVAFSELETVMGDIRRMTQLPAVLTNMSDVRRPDAAKVVADALKGTNVAAVVVIADVAGQPSLVVAPEARWATVNAAALVTPGVSAEMLALRLRKETWRAFGYLMGAANSSFEHCLLKPVFKPEDLDKLKGQTLSPEPFNKILQQAAVLGVKPTRMTTYRKACEEGWAPAPTNDFQRAIWEEMKKKENIQ